MRRIAASLLLALIVALMGSTVTASAQTRTFLFHMNTNYAHGKKPNYGYPATKADNEQRAYVTVTSYTATAGSPTISMYVGNPTAQVSTAWSWRGTGSHTLDYTISGVGKGSTFCLCAEQFGPGSVVLSGRWTP